MDTKLRIIIFGVSGTAYKIINYLNKDTTEIICFIDNFKANDCELFENKRIFSPEKVKELDYDYIIIASVSKYYELSEQLLNLTVDKNKIIQAYNFTGVLPDTFFYNNEIVEDINFKRIFTDVHAFHRGNFGWGV